MSQKYVIVGYRWFNGAPTVSARPLSHGKMSLWGLPWGKAEIKGHSGHSGDHSPQDTTFYSNSCFCQRLKVKSLRGTKAFLFHQGKFTRVSTSDREPLTAHSVCRGAEHLITVCQRIRQCTVEDYGAILEIHFTLQLGVQCGVSRPAH